MNKNKFIVFEGIDGSGKSTLAKMLNDYLNQKGVATELTGEPYRKGFGAGIRQLFTDYDDKLNAKTELFMFEAARVEHVETVIKPAIKAGKTVICDRFTDSSVAYQGYAQNGVCESLIHELNDIAVGNVKPDVVFWIDADTKECMSRSKKTDAKDNKPLEFYEKCREYYNKRASENNSFIRIDGNGTVEQVFARVVSYFKYDNANHCIGCGAIIPEGMSFCRQCNPNTDHKHRCPGCLKRVDKKFMVFAQKGDNHPNMCVNCYKKYKGEQ